MRRRMGEGLGFTGLLEAFQGIIQYTGAWDKDLDNFLGVFKTMDRMCAVIKKQILTAMPIMMSGDAPNFFSDIMQQCERYEKATKTCETGAAPTRSTHASLRYGKA